MFHFFKRNGLQVVTHGEVRSAGSGLFFFGLVCVLFALAIFANPDLLALLIATLLLIVGVTLLGLWWRVRNLK